MIIVTILIIAQIAAIAIFLTTRRDGFVSGMISILVAVFLLCCGVAIISENTFTERKIKMLNAKREALSYQIENNIYFGDAVGEFNSEVIDHQMGHLNPWTSWLYGSYWMEIEPIDLT